MDSESTMLINISIQGYNMAIKIERKDELVYRDAAKRLNIRIQEYMDRYRTLDFTTMMVYVAFDMAFERECLSHNQDLDPMADVVKGLVEKINQTIEK